MRKLFLSFSGLLYALASGKITQDDLNTGLFYFGCRRQHAFHPEQDAYNEITSVSRDNAGVGERAHALLVEGLIKAEAEGRVNWRGENENRYGELSKLLVANGLPELHMSQDQHHSYSYPGVEDLVKEQMSESLQVVWRD